jgi:tRNA(fMet)-specific endonuclease VapC
VSLIYMLDTNISSAAMKGDPSVGAKLDVLPQDTWCVSAVTASEHVFGVAKRPEALRLALVVREFLQVAEVLPWDRAAADAHGVLRAHLKRAGTPVDSYDSMIAAHALSRGLILVTDNVKHFSPVPGLRIENWLRP